MALETEPSRAGPGSDIPVSDIDLFSDPVILDPHPHNAAIRDLGPLVYLPQYDLYAISRYADVKRALMDNKRLLSGQGVAGYRFPPEVDVSNTLVSDEPLHSRFRQVIGAPLKPPALEELTGQLETAAFELVDRIISLGDFDGVADFARFLPVTIISTLVGLPEQGRERMLEWAAASFDILGVPNARGQAAFAEVGAMIEYVRSQCRPDTVRPGSWAAQIWEAVADGRVTPQEAGTLHIDILTPSLDTTIFATGHLLHQLATNPDQWDALKADHSLIPHAIDEAIRLESPVRTFARVAAEDIDVDGSTLPAGARTLVMYGSANRDERQWEEPDRYWIQRPNVAAHLGFGQGRHTCAGMHLAKLEMRSLLKAVLARVDRIEVGAPTYSLNNLLRGFATLPTRFAAA